MISLRLPEELEKKLTDLAKMENKTKTDLIKESLVYYLENVKTPPSPYTLGQKFFGQYTGGIPDKSTNHRELIKKRIASNHEESSH